MHINIYTYEHTHILRPSSNTTLTSNCTSIDVAVNDSFIASLSGADGGTGH